MTEPSGSLSKKLRRLFTEVRREAKRNPVFAARLESALDTAAADFASRMDSVANDSGEDDDFLGQETTIDVNPVAIAQRVGADGLLAELDGLPETALRGLIAEHNLDPAEETGGLQRPALADHIVRQAMKRIERDRRLFEY